MPNLIDQMEILKNLPDGALAGELGKPSGAVPPYLVLSEVNRRKDMRQRFAGQAAMQKPQTTVAQDASASLAPPSPPAGNMGAAAGQGAPMAMPGGVGSPPAMPGAPAPAPTGIAAAPGYAKGGVVGYAKGGALDWVGNQVMGGFINPLGQILSGIAPRPHSVDTGTFGYDPTRDPATNYGASQNLAAPAPDSVTAYNPTRDPAAGYGGTAMAGIAGATPPGASGAPTIADAVAPDATSAGDTGTPQIGQDYSKEQAQYQKQLDDANAAKARDPWLALTQAGLSIAGGTSPYALTNIGQGGMEGLNTYAALSKSDAAARDAALAGLTGIKGQQTKDQLANLDQANTEAKLAIGKISPAALYAQDYMAASPEERALMTQFQTKSASGIPGILADGSPAGPSEAMTGPPTPFGSPNARSALNPTGAIPNQLPDGTPLSTRAGPLVAQLPDDIPLEGVKRFAALADSNPANAAQIAAILSYRDDPTKSIPARGNLRQQIVAEAESIDPTYDMKKFPTRNAALKSFTGNGANSMAIQSLNNITGHLAKLSDAYDTLQNSGYPAWNAAANTVKANTPGEGASAINAVKAVTTGVATEIDRALKAGAPDVAGMKAWGSTIDPNASPDGQKGSITAMLDLLDTRAASVRNTYLTSMGRPYDHPLLDDKSRSELIGVAKKYGIDLSRYSNLLSAPELANVGGTTAPAPGAAPTAPATGAPPPASNGVVDYRTYFGGGA